MNSPSSFQDQFVMQFKTENVVNFRVRFPFTDNYKLIFFIKDSNDHYYEEMCEFRIYYVGEIAMTPFPPSIQSLWGASQKINDKLLITVGCSEVCEYCLMVFACADFDKLKEYHLAFQFAVTNENKNMKITFPNLAIGFLGPQSLNSLFQVHLLEQDDYFIEFDKNNIHLKFRTEAFSRFTCKLLEVIDETLINRNVNKLLQRKNEYLFVNLILPSTNVFLLQLFVSMNSSTFVNVYNLLLKSHKISATANYPKQLNHWNGFLHEPLRYELNNVDEHTFKLEVKNAHKIVMKFNNTIYDFHEVEHNIWRLETSFSEYKCGKVLILACFNDKTDCYNAILQYKISC
ncbi:hypothetical protein HELRODRAFT_158516 [Helobdella robusta]|uniref:KY-like immunoglobulin-like domain-containing protein n=1 Tax=Helobdella robusta TaxID=6412 RepID=T1EMW3_HELRO|nr:hypothetical protein HELRODRAFT_158516 [Helobdella robusta]ESO12094.1 hypothetical protein HELRODRAFT_158516 [Helobdella robusta]